MADAKNDVTDDRARMASSPPSIRAVVPPPAPLRLYGIAESSL